MRAAILGLLLLEAGCSTDRCKKGTLFLSYTLTSGAEAADAIDVTLAIGTAAAQTMSVARKSRGASGSIEVDFATYPAGKSLALTLTARAGAQLLASASQTATAGASCSALSFTLDASAADMAGGDADGFVAVGDFTIAPSSCGTTGDACTTDAQCCSRLCDVPTQRCVSAMFNCAPTGAGCKTPTDCCSLHCNTSSTCDAAACVGDAQTCVVDRDCCSGSCLGGICQTLNANCKTAGNACNGGAECCSTVCNNHVCSLRGSYCAQSGDVCYRDTDCCIGSCALAPGGVVGTCGANGTCAVGGTACNSCGTCCSGVCAPFGSLGSMICTASTGCRTAGDSCVSASDCCGGAGSGVPGDGNGSCAPVAGASLGHCSNQGCAPEGTTCHNAGSLCSVSGRQDCCVAGGATKMCKADVLDSSRCYGLTTCQAAAQPCANDTDCCGAYCVPNGSGILSCVSASCIASGAACSSTSQCCRGLTCVMPTGSVRGACRSLGATCALYGQACTLMSDCCNGVPCTNQRCTPPAM
jgi:hypothetical protein